MYYIQFGKLKEFKSKEFTEIYTNQEMIQKANELLGSGTRFVEAFFVMEGHADHDIEIWWEIENFAQLDNWSNDNAELKAFREEYLGKYGNIFEWVRSKIIKAVDKVHLIDPDVIKKD